MTETLSAKRIQARHRDWADLGEQYFAEQLAAVGDEALREQSALPGWSRAHVVGHVARNADALVNLVQWARTGVETPMYPDPDARERDIESSATQPAPMLRADVRESTARLAQAWDSLPEQAWDVRVRSALGRDVPLRETLWMRIREVWVHAVDLRGDRRFDDLPVQLIAALFDDCTDTLTRRGGPDVLLVPTDVAQTWRIGDDGAPFRSVSAPSHRLLGWAMGRAPAPPPVPLPPLPRWL